MNNSFEINPFFSKNANNIINNHKIQDASPYVWLISSDKIFSSEIEGFKDFTKFYGMEFRIRRFSLFAKEKLSDSAVRSDDVKVYLPPGRHCALIQSRISNGSLISKISIKKIHMLSESIDILEEKEFSNCAAQSFERIGEIAAFTFRYSSYSDSYTDFKGDGTKKGTSATDINLITWEINEK